ncbi:diguanylate cyclase [Rhodovulum sp. DZ06]|uniref:diguanylate cyclase n=1 Tax=Rhodovulum sp. DZ06 TaxID=3425126 RepID=UPI003D327E0D
MSGRILVADDSAANRMLLAARLGGAYYETLTAADGREALERAFAESPDLILLGLNMVGIDGCAACRRLKADPRTAHIPVILLTERNTPEERIAGLDSGADDFLSRPVSDLELFARVRNLVRMKNMVDELRLRDETAQALGIDPRDEAAQPPGDVILLCADPAHARARGALLAAQMDVTVRLPRNDRAALAEAEKTPPDAIVLERDLGATRDGLRLVSALRARPATRHVAVIMLVRPGDLEGAAAGLDLGANDYLVTPVDGNELVARLASQIRRKRASDRLRDALRDGLMMAITDPLTGLYNRRYAETHLRRIADQCAGAAQPLSVMLLDLDKFKTVNDRFGHAAGDEVLSEFARRLRANVRGVDLVARMGGEEFLVAMPDADAEGAALAAERIRAAVAAEPFAIGADPGRIDVTVSIGLTVAGPEALAAPVEAEAQRPAALPGAGGLAEAAAPRPLHPLARQARPARLQARPDLPRTLLAAADQALYASKDGGRNMVTTSAA